MQNQFTEKGYDRRGAFMGRYSSPSDVKPEGKITLWPVYLDGQGYDDNGAYWGVGTPLWCAEDESGDYRQFARAGSYVEAQAALGLSPSQLARDYGKEFSLFLKSYLEAVLFTETDTSEDEESEGEPLDSRYTIGDFEVSSWDEAERDCRAFLSRLLGGAPLSRVLTPDNMAQAGHDFWLTRNGHGSGFWDRPAATYAGQGDALADIARGFPEKTADADGERVFFL